LCRYKLSLLAGDETGDTNFIIFGRIAQRLTKKAADTLVADNPVGFVPDEITRLLERTYIWNVSFTDSTIETGNITFQVNAIVAEISDETTVVPVTPTQSQTSSLMLSRGAAPGMEDTPQSSNPLALSQMQMTSETSLAFSATPTKMGLPITDLMGTPQGGKDAVVDEVGQSLLLLRVLIAMVQNPRLIGLE
jgi:replication factor A1